MYNGIFNPGVGNCSCGPRIFFLPEASRGRTKRGAARLSVDCFSVFKLFPTTRYLCFSKRRLVNDCLHRARSARITIGVAYVSGGLHDASSVYSFLVTGFFCLIKLKSFPPRTKDGAARAICCKGLDQRRWTAQQSLLDLLTMPKVAHTPILGPRPTR